MIPTDVAPVGSDLGGALLIFGVACMVAGDPQTRVTPKGVVDIAERLTSKAVA